MGSNRRNRILLLSTRLSIEPLENRALLAGVTADIPLSNSLTTDTAQVNTDVISSRSTGFPTNISVEAGDGQATVFWNSSDPQAFTYWVDISLDGGITWGTQSFYIPQNPSSGTVNKLINGVDYLLKARDPSNGITSNTVSATPNSEIVLGAPQAPVNVIATVSNSSAFLDWEISTSEVLPILQYEITWQSLNQDLDRWTLSSSTRTNTAPSIIDSLSYGDSYFCSVRLRNSIGWGHSSAPILITPGSGVITAPTAPRNLQAIAGNGEVALSWDAPLSNGGAAISQYEIAYRANSDTDWTYLTGTATSTTLPGFINGVTYQFAVSAQNSVGWSEYSSIVTATPYVPITAPTAPRNLQAIAGNGEVALSWDAPLSNGGAAISQYEIAYRANSDTDWTYLTGTATSTTLPGFINGVTYQFAVSAQNSVGWSEYSSIVTATPYVPINNPPSLNVLNDMLINEDSQGQTVGLTGITVGNDGNQSLRVTSVSSNTELLPSPIVTYTSPNTTGSLAFTPVANQKGTATITVTVENGGLDDNLSTVGDNKTVQRSFQVTVLEVIASASSVVLAKDSSQNLYVDTKPVTYNQQQVPQDFFGSTVVGAETVDSQNFLLLKPSEAQNNQPTHRLLTDETWKINGIFNALQNESSPILEISGREVSDTLNIATVSGAYEINGVNNPTLIVRRGKTYLFNLNTSGHPFYLQTTGAGYQSANIYIGFSGNGQTSGEHQWVVPEDAPDEIFYQCKFHSVMFGKIIVVD